MIEGRKHSKLVKIGSLEVGGGSPVKIKGMLKSRLENKSALLKEAKKLQKEGAQALRVAVKDSKDANIVKEIKKHVALPLAADVHFHYRAALAAIEAGFDGIRLNPLNIYKKKEVKEVVKAAKKAGISIRVGVNSGGFKKKFSNGTKLAQAMVEKVREYIRLLEKESFFDIMVSLKASDINTTISANRIFAGGFDYPVHLGVTATGYFLEGIVKSALGIGALLREGIGDIIRVSLTAPSSLEIQVAKYILQTLGLKNQSPQIISCPTCSRCQVDLIKIVNEFQKELPKLKESGVKFPQKIAIMGCEVNGPGEAAQSDMGIAFGKNKAVLFRKKDILESLPKDISMRKLIEKLGVC